MIIDEAGVAAPHRVAESDGQGHVQSVVVIAVSAPNEGHDQREA
jgi:hypothetical protein